MGESMDLNFLSSLFGKIDLDEEESFQEKKAQFAKMGKELFAIYSGMTSAGFTEEQAMKLMTICIGATIAGGKA